MRGEAAGYRSFMELWDNRDPALFRRLFAIGEQPQTCFANQAFGAGAVDPRTTNSTSSSC